MADCGIYHTQYGEAGGCLRNIAKILHKGKSQVCNISYTIWDKLIHAIFPELGSIIYEFTIQ
jgi:hypothetical protein